MLRLDMNFVYNIVNLIVLYLLLKHFLIQPVMNVINKRQAMIDQSMNQAKSMEGQATVLKKQYEEKLAASAEQGSKLVEEAKVQAKNQYDRIVKEAEDQASRVMDQASKKAEADQQKAMREAEAKVAGLVMAAAAKVVGKEVNAMENRSLYDSFLAEAGDLHDAGSN